MDYPYEKQGFFVKIGEKKYSEPFASLKEARNEARPKGPSLQIFHGVLKFISETEIDDSELFLIPKLKKTGSEKS
jgi:hypothetical protein